MLMGMNSLPTILIMIYLSMWGGHFKLVTDNDSVTVSTNMIMQATKHTLHLKASLVG